MPESVPRSGFAAEYPFVSHFADVGGRRYHYLDEGPQDDPRPLLFVHGNPTWSFAWRNLIRGLSPTRRCIAIDHIGCGLSEKPQDYDYTLATHIANLVEFIEQRDLRNITLIAHDWGGCIGMGAAGRMPVRFRRFVLMNTAAFRSQRIPLRIAVCRIPILGALGVRGLNLFARAAQQMAVVRRLPAPVRRGYLAPYDSWKNRITIQRFVEDIPLNDRHPSYRTLVEVESGLAQFQQSPMLLAWGMLDWCFTPEFLAKWQERFPQAIVEPLETASHYLFEDEPERLLSAVRGFLKATDQADSTG